MVRRVGTVVCLVALAYAGASSAQAPVANADREAREHFERGRNAFTIGDYPLAAGQFEQAYALSHRSALLYNIGTAYERLHRWLDAQRAFQRYVDENPMAPDRPEVESRLRVISAELQRPAVVTVPMSPTRQVPPATVLVRVPPPDAPRPWRTVFWASGGLGVIAGAVTIGLGVVANQRYNTLLSTCAPNCLQIDVNDMRQRELFVNLGIAATSVFALGSVVGFLFDYFRDPQTVAVSPRAFIVPVPGGASLGFEGTL